MTDQSTNLQQLLSDSTIREAVQALGPLPFAGTGWSSPTPILDPNAVGSEIFGVRIDLRDRDSLLRALTRSFPMHTDPSSGKAVVDYRPATESITMNISRTALVGPLATAAAALQALANHAQGLDEIRPLRPSPGNTPDHAPLIALIRGVIADLQQQFATGRPLVPQVDSLVATLYTDTCEEGEEDEVVAVGGYLRDLGDRCGIDLTHPGSLAHEKIYTNYTTLVALTRMFDTEWKAARNYNDGSFLTIGLQDLHRHLFAIVAALGRLRALVPSTAWATTEIDDPPIVAAELWNWMHQYSSTTALAMLLQGEDGIFGINTTMRTFNDVLGKLIVARQGRNKPGRREQTDRDDACAGVPNAFDDDEVQDVIRELRCEVQRVIRATACQDVADIGRAQRRRAVRPTDASNE